MKRRDFLKALSVLPAASLLAGTASCTRRRARKVLILAFDGMDPRLCERFISEGRMPSAARLARGISIPRLATTFPPQSPVAWSSFITGRGPEYHGIYDFVHRDPATLRPYLSTSRVVPASDFVELGGWKLPLNGTRVELLRRGEPFWKPLVEAGVRVSLYRLPVDFPPVSASGARILTGLGTPDLRGSQGSFTFFTDNPLLLSDDTAGGFVVAVRDSGDGVYVCDIEGPANSWLEGNPPALARLSISVDRASNSALLESSGDRVLLAMGEPGPWTRVRFDLLPGLSGVDSCARFLLRRVDPHLELYMTPLNMSPWSPALPISAPSWWSRELAMRLGTFFTKGFPEDTKVLSRGLLSDEEYIAMAFTVMDEQRAMFFDQLGRLDEGLSYFYFTCLDLNVHMFYRALDLISPLHAGLGSPARAFIPYLYGMMDEIIGAAIDASGSDTEIIICSDHGFAPFRRGFNLNTWLARNGYMTAPAQGAGSIEPFPGVDWASTAAYGLGINSLYLNLRGREPSGAVEPEDAETVLRRLARDLVSVVDPATGMRVVSRVIMPPLETGPDTPPWAPDLIVGYAPGYRSSWETALGGMPGEVLADNLDPWSGDHCVAPEHVPGTFLSSSGICRPGMSLQEVGLLAASLFDTRLENPEGGD
jgi:predicted AlkP superfamily phosphohydrolase/phosphomutase